jgi:hypothetical protein
MAGKVRIASIGLLRRGWACHVLARQLWLGLFRIGTFGRWFVQDGHGRNGSAGVAPRERVGRFRRGEAGRVWIGRARTG